MKLGWIDNLTRKDWLLFAVWYGLLLAVCLLLLSLTGCSVSMTFGTGNRQAGTWAEHSEIPATIKEIAPVAEGLASGAVKGLKGTP